MEADRGYNAAFWHSKPDFVNLLTHKFNDDVSEGPEAPLDQF